MARQNKFAEPDVENDENVEMETRTFFPSLEGDYEEEVEYEEDPLYEFDKIFFGETQGADDYLGDGDLYEGKPILSEVYSYSYDYDGEEVTKYRCNLRLVDYDNEEYCQININLKSDGDVQRNVHGKSTLFRFLGSLMNLEQEGWTSRNNRIKKTDLGEFREFINGLGSMTIKGLEQEPINDGGRPWYYYEVIEVQN